MYILSVGMAFPGPLHKQDDLLPELSRAWGDRVTDRERSLLERLSKSAGVQSKHLAMDPGDYSVKTSFTERNRVFQSVGLELGNQAVSSALNAVDALASDIDAIFFTTVTGLSVPSVDSLVAGSLGMRENIKRVPLFGLGCVAGVAGLARVHDYLLAWPTHAVVLLAVELCSLTLQIDDLSPESIVASTLFGDGAAAVLCVGENHPLVGRAALESLASTSRLYPNTKHIMGWDVGSHGFKILLDPGVPQLVKDFFADDVRRFLSQHNLETSDIRSWISHPGGPKVLQALTSSLDLTDDALSVSRRQLAQVGNLSSASVLGILKQTIIEHGDKMVKPSDHALMMAMGPGFCSEQLLCRWT
jgi:alkylresorcinol/alkylpyrone synthase